MANNAKVGDIYYSSWGYDQTNIDFYQIVAKKGKMSFMLQKIGSMISRHTDWGVDYVMPNPKHTKGEPMLKRMTEYGFNLNSYATASPWDGKEEQETCLLSRTPNDRYGEAPEEDELESIRRSD